MDRAAPLLFDHAGREMHFAGSSLGPRPDPPGLRRGERRPRAGHVLHRADEPARVARAVGRRARSGRPTHARDHRAPRRHVPHAPHRVGRGACRGMDVAEVQRSTGTRPISPPDSERIASTSDPPRRHRSSRRRSRRRARMLRDCAEDTRRSRSPDFVAEYDACRRWGGFPAPPHSSPGTGPSETRSIRVYRERSGRAATRPSERTTRDRCGATRLGS